MTGSFGSSGASTGAAALARRALARKIQLRPSSSAADGFCEIIEEALDHLRANTGRTLRGSMDGVHEMRAALRGARAALQLFKCHLDPAMVNRFSASLRCCGQVFGKARDWDVFLQDMLPVSTTAGLSAKAVRNLRSVAQGRRQTAHAAVADTIRSRAFGTLVSELAAWAESGMARPRTLGDKRMGRPLKTLAPRLLSAVASKVRTRARHADRLTAAELHALRKSLRKFRYDVLSFSALFPHRAVQTYGRRCDAVLKILGVINDAAVSHRLAESLRARRRTTLAAPVAALKRRSQLRGREARLDLHDALQKLLKTPQFWH